MHYVVTAYGLAKLTGTATYGAYWINVILSINVTQSHIIFYLSSSIFGWTRPSSSVSYHTRRWPCAAETCRWLIENKKWMCYIDGQNNKYSVLNECNRMLKYNILWGLMTFFFSRTSHVRPFRTTATARTKAWNVFSALEALTYICVYSAFVLLYGGNDSWHSFMLRAR
jgi:hypothetical protein